MWLLETHYTRLRWFAVEDILRLGGYAILSHVWSSQEDTFQHVKELEGLPLEQRRSLLSHKIQGCCHYAASLGFSWVWIDTCCINKESTRVPSSIMHYSRALSYACLVRQR